MHIHSYVCVDMCMQMPVGTLSISDALKLELQVVLSIKPEFLQEQRVFLTAESNLQTCVFFLGGGGAVVTGFLHVIGLAVLKLNL